MTGLREGFCSMILARPRRILIIGMLCAALTACQGAPLVRPERDLSRDYQAEVSELRRFVRARCAQVDSEADAPEIRIRRMPSEVLVSIAAMCEPGGVSIRCILVAGPDAVPVCARDGR